ncbi:MAG: RES family NAD+ phosphorylase [Chitinophagales bacterium]|nr:RES family NAD+ phosphorylase [Chitinophagales bacterium]
MIVFRIVHEKWAKELTASGNEARWNSKGNFVIYTSASRALACLENIVHRSGEGDSRIFKTMVIEIPDYLKCDEIFLKKLMKNWKERKNFIHTQHLGNEWIRANTSAILKVPSSIIPEEHNYILNPAHKDFKKVKLRGVKKFNFDSRVLN